jgi:hypothetical protein
LLRLGFFHLSLSDRAVEIFLGEFLGKLQKRCLLQNRGLNNGLISSSVPFLENLLSISILYALRMQLTLTD